VDEVGPTTFLSGPTSCLPNYTTIKFIQQNDPQNEIWYKLINLLQKRMTQSGKWFEFIRFNKSIFPFR